MRHLFALRYGGWGTFVLCLLLLPTALIGQEFCHIDTSSITQGSITHSCFGAAHTPQRNLHILIVFVRYNNASPGSYDTNYWPDGPTLPVFARDTLGLPGFNQLFASDTNQIKNNPGFKNISQFYYEASNGKFLLTADIYPQQVEVPWQSGQYTKMSTNALDSIALNDPGFDWNRYDNRTNNPDFASDNSLSPPDSLIDYIVFVHRRGTGGNQGGFASSSTHMIAGTPFQVDHYHLNSAIGPDIRRHYDFFIHEFSHNLFNCPHYMGTNPPVSGNKYNAYSGWGMIASSVGIFQTANAWERWYLGWIEPDSIVSDTTIYLTDFSIPETGTYSQAVMIPIPHSEGGMLWLENHQKESLWDEKPFYKGNAPTSPGIYGLISQASMSDRDSPLFSAISTNYNSKSADWCNGLRPLNASGLFDPIITGDPPTSVSGVGGTHLTYDRDSADVYSNPFSGVAATDYFAIDTATTNIFFNFETNSYNTSNNNLPSHRAPIWREQIGGIDTSTYISTGDNRMAFQVGDVIVYPPQLLGHQKVKI